MNPDQLIEAFKRNTQALSPKELAETKKFSPSRLEFRKISKEFKIFLLKEALAHLTEEKQGQIWIKTFKKTPYIGLQSIAIDFFKARQKRKSFNLNAWWPELSKLCPKIDCWTTGDMMASLYSQIHESDPKLVYPTLLQWNQSGKPWLIRMSILSLYYYSACRKNYPSFENSVSLITPHLDHPHYFVQKAIGWTLREIHNVYPIQAKSYISKNLLLISPVAFSAATEKIKGTQKEAWKAERAFSRKKAPAKFH